MTVLRSLRARLFLAVTVTVLVSIAVTLGVGTLLLRRSVERQVLSNLSRQADLLAVRERNNPLDDRQLRQLRAVLLRQGIGVQVLRRPPRLLPADQQQALADGKPVEGKSGALGRDVLYAARPTGTGFLLLLRPARLGPSDWRPFVGGFVVAGLFGAAIAAAVSLLLARAIARPVRRVADASRSLAAGVAPGPIPVEGSDELSALATSFNEMSWEIERARESEQAFLLSVSHELKTPLTAIRGYAEALSEGAVSGEEAAQVIEAEAARLERLVQDLLDLARLNRRAFTVRRETVDLAALADDAVRRYESRARSFGVELASEPYRGAFPAAGYPPAAGDPDRIVQVISNLVENAIRSTPAGGRVVVRAAPQEVEVEDNGPGLAAEDLPRAFERFYLHGRYGGERPVGSGLGLAVVKELTEAMGGTVSVRSAPGEGAMFTVRLPAATETTNEQPAESTESTEATTEELQESAEPGRSETSSI